MSDFFDKKDQAEEVAEQEAQPETIKVGDLELKPEELEELVGAGRRVREFEEKQGQTLEDVTKSWGKRGEVIGAFKKATGYDTPEEYLAAKEKQIQQAPVGEESEVREQVIAEAKKYGLLTNEEAKQIAKQTMEELFDAQYQRRRAGERLLSKTRRVVKEAARDGKPEVSPDKLLEFMSDPANPKDPEVAYKVMFEKELDEWKEKQLNKAKGTRVVTEEGSTAGGKQFEKPEITDSNLVQALRDHLGQG